MKNIKIQLIALLILFSFSACDDDTKEGIKENQPPTKTVLVTPANEASDILINPNFSWQNSTDPEKGAISYELYISTNQNFDEKATKKAIDIHQNHFSFVNFELERNKRYYWKVIASDEKKLTSESKVFSFISIDVDLRINLSLPEDNGVVKGGTSKVSWKIARNSVYKDEVTYSIFIRNGSPDFGYPTKKGLKETESTLTNLRGNGQYYWAVAAYDNLGTKVAQSNTFKFTTPNTLPSPAVLRKEEEMIIEDNLNVLFKWKESEDQDRIIDNGTLRPEELSYDFYLSTDNVFTKEDLKATALKTNQFTMNKLEFNTKYWAKVVTKDENNGVVESNVISLTTREKPKENDVIIEEGTWEDARDNKIYKTVTINGKTWLAENYAYIPFIEKNNSNGEKMICSVYGLTNPNSIQEMKASENYDKYGVLYSGDCLSIIAPPGWHVATDEDWKEIEILSGMTESEADKTGYRNNARGTTQYKFIRKDQPADTSTGTSPSNEMQTSIVYGGYLSANWKGEEFKGINNYTYVWTGSEYIKWGMKGFYFRAFSSKRQTVERNSKGKKYRMYIRLVKN